jgi:hypothetical protein
MNNHAIDLIIWVIVKSDQWCFYLFFWSILSTWSWKFSFLENIDGQASMHQKAKAQT